MPRRSTIPLALAALLLAGPVCALEYEIRLHNGNVFQSRYEPVVTPWDPTRIMFMTVFGNPMAIARDSVKEVISLTEASGFGKRLDETTILIGLAPNDNPSPEEQAALEAQAGADAAQTPYTIPLVAEPNQGGGIPLQFLNYTTPPLGGGAAAGSAAASRRGGGGTQFVQPQTQN